MSEKYSVGLDIGIASVGWSVLSVDNENIEDLGVNLFSARSSAENKERRKARGARRLTRRRVTRLNDAKSYLNDNEFIRQEQYKHACPYTLRVNGLSQELTKGEIYNVITHIIKKRGISYLTDVDEENNDGKNYKAQVQKNKALLKEKTPGQIQLERLHEGGRIRTGINDKGEYILNVFNVSAYGNELERILKTQSQYHPEITEVFIKYFTDPKDGLIYRKRPYYHGPGNEHNPSEYGRWADYPQTGEPKENIFDQLIGTDLQGKVRASTNSVTAQRYNLLNDLNNLTFTNRSESKLNTEEKVFILNYLMTEDINRFGAKNFIKLLIDEEIIPDDSTVKSVKGWRLDGTEKNPETIHSMASYRAWRKLFAEKAIDIATIPDHVLDEIAMVTTINTELDAVKRTFDLKQKNHGLVIDLRVREVVEENFMELRKKKETSQSWHSFSLDTMQQLIPELLHTSEEQNTILERLGIKKDLRNKYADHTTLPINEIVEDIYNPTVSKSVRQSLKVLNAIVKKYGKENLEHVVIEMPRDKNEDEQKKTIREIQKSNKNRREESRKYFQKKIGWSDKEFEDRIQSGGFAKKLHYYYEQDGICAYSGQPIQPSDLLGQHTEIDHIIPLSISLDDSLNNKVLVFSKANQEKGQRSPKQAYDEGAELGQTWEEYKAWVNSNKRFKKHKKKYLLETRNIFDPEVAAGFIARNLNDTRYASRTVLNAVQSFFYNSDTKARVINGAYTHTLRKKWGEALDKQRETHHHHAVDATLCAISLYVREEKYRYMGRKDDGKVYMLDEITEDLLTYQDYKNKNLYGRKNYVPEWNGFIEQLVPLKLHPRIKFSHQVDRKWNRKVSNATIYSTRDRQVTNKKGKLEQETLVLGKTANIYTAEGYADFVKNKEDLLMKELDVQTFDKLCKIEAEYPDFKEVEQSNGKIKKVDVSPFKRYCEANNVPAIRKYSKKGNGPFIKQIKYYGDELIKHLNITKDSTGQSIEQTKRNKKVVLLNQNAWRTDVYYDEKQNKFILVGIKYYHLKFVNGQYGIPQQTYNELLEENRISEKAEFRFSLYKNSGLRVADNGEFIDLLYYSKNESGNNRFQANPIEKSKFNKTEKIPVFNKVDARGYFKKTVKSGMKLTKFHTDILGNKHFVTQEQLKGIISES